MKLAFSSNAYRNYSIEESIDLIHLAGYSGVEIMCDIPHAFPPLSDEKIKSIRSHGRIDTTSYFSNPEESQYVSLGYNWRMSSLTAALGISQLNKLDKLIKMRQNVAQKLSTGLSKFREISIFNPPSLIVVQGPIQHLFPITLPPPSIARAVIILSSPIILL